MDAGSVAERCMTQPDATTASATMSGRGFMRANLSVFGVTSECSPNRFPTTVAARLGGRWPSAPQYRERMIMALDGLRVAARTLRKQPVFTTVVVLSLAIGIALNTTMYGVLDALMRPRIDMRSPEQLFWIRFYGDYKRHADYRARDAAITSGMRTYESITRIAFGYGSDELIEHGQNYREGSIAAVGSNFFDVIGTRPTPRPEPPWPRTRTPTRNPSSSATNSSRRSFARANRRSVREFSINREAHVIIGVVPATANFPSRTDGPGSSRRPNAGGIYIRLMRLRDGATAADADRELKVVATRIAVAEGDDPRYVAFRFHRAVDPDFQVHSFELALILAVAAALARRLRQPREHPARARHRASARARFALCPRRLSTRRRVIAHLLTESVLLAAIGLTLGLGAHVLELACRRGVDPAERRTVSRRATVQLARPPIRPLPYPCSA